MNDNNDYSPRGFLGQHVYWGLLLTWCYRVTIFSLFRPLDKSFAAAMLYAFVGFGLLIGYLLTVSRNRSTLNLIVTVLTPFELYTSLMLWQERSTLILISAAAALVISAVFFLRNLLRPIRCPERSRSIITRRIKAGLINSRLIIGICMSTILFAAVGNYHSIIADTTVRPTTLSEEEIARETTLLTESFRGEQWYPLSAEERLQLVERLVELERQYLGIPYRLKVTADRMPDTRNGIYTYSGSEYLISINADLLKNHAPIEVVSTTLHECYHAYQHALINLYFSSDAQYQDLQLFSKVKIYADEFMCYKKPGQAQAAFEEYYTQKIEEEARKYADENVNRYFPDES